jgi:hypothetical protein
VVKLLGMGRFLLLLLVLGSRNVDMAYCYVLPRLGRRVGNRDHVSVYPAKSPAGRADLLVSLRRPVPGAESHELWRLFMRIDLPDTT